MSFLCFSGMSDWVSSTRLSLVLQALNVYLFVELPSILAAVSKDLKICFRVCPRLA